MRVGRKHKVHGPGLAYIGVTLLLGVGAINSQNSLLFFIFGAALGGVLVSGVLSGAMLMGLDVERHGPVRLTVGEPASYVYVVRNRNRWIPAFAVRITEHSAQSGSVNRRQAWSDRLRFADAFIAHIPARSCVHAQAPARGVGRGPVQLSRFVVWSAFPFGVAKKSVIFAQDEDVLIRPEPITPTLRWEVVLAARGAEGSLAGKVGEGEEFFALRERRDGDSPRLIAWRASAKLDRLLVREHAAPAPGKVWIALNFNAIGEENIAQQAIERAISYAAGLLDAAWSKGLAPGLLVPACGVSIAPTEAGSGAERDAARGAVLDALAWLEPATAAPAIPLRRAEPMIVVHAGPIDRRIAPDAAAHLAAIEPSERVREERQLTVASASPMAEAVA